MSELTRFLFHTGDYSASKRVVKSGAFLPRDGRTSAFDIQALPEPDIWDIGDRVARDGERHLRGRGDFTYRALSDVGLRFERDDRPPRHGNLVGWPEEGPEIKARQKAVAVTLAARADLVLVST